MKLIHLAVLAAAEGEAPGVFNLDLGVSAWTFIIFVILMFILTKFAFPPILGYAAAREKRIQDTLDEARRHREESERLLEEQRRELERARQQAQLMITEGRAGAERVREEMLVTARTEQEALLQRARHEIEREREHAIESLRREAIELSLAAATQLVRHRVDSAEDRRLVTEYLRSVEGPNGAGAA
jgi:F-type H+-transporting ATPase subunit b